MKLKSWWVTHIHSGKKYESCVLSTDKYQASTYVEGQVLNVEESWKPLTEGTIVTSSGWALYFFDNHTSKDYEVTKEWKIFLRNVILITVWRIKNENYTKHPSRLGLVG